MCALQCAFEHVPLWLNSAEWDVPTDEEPSVINNKSSQALGAFMILQTWKTLKISVDYMCVCMNSRLCSDSSTPSLFLFPISQLSPHLYAAFLEHHFISTVYILL